MRHLLLFIAVVICCQCKKSLDQPSHHSKQLEAFARVYVDYLQIIASDTARTEFRGKYLNQALTKNNMTEEQFTTAFENLKTHPEQASRALGAIQVGLQALETKGQKQ